MTVTGSLYLWQTLAVLLLLLPAVIALGYGYAWRSALLKPWAYALVGACCLFVVYVLVGELLFVPALDAVLFVRSSGSSGRPLQPYFLELVPTPITLLVLSYPVMRWLRGVFPGRGRT
jgi:hypothetical protein